MKNLNIAVNWHVPFREITGEVFLRGLPVYPSINRWMHLPWYSQRKLRMRYVDEVRWTLIATKQAGVFPCRVKVTPILYLPGHRRRDVNNYAPKWLLDAWIGFAIIDDDQEHISEGLPILVEIPAGSRPYLEVVVIPIELRYQRMVDGKPTHREEVIDCGCK